MVVLSRQHNSPARADKRVASFVCVSSPAMTRRSFVPRARSCEKATKRGPKSHLLVRERRPRYKATQSSFLISAFDFCCSSERASGCTEGTLTPRGTTIRRAEYSIPGRKEAISSRYPLIVFIPARLEQKRISALVRPTKHCCKRANAMRGELMEWMNPDTGAS